VAWVEEVMVDERARREGHGARMIERAELWAHGAGAAYLALATRRAGAFYLSLGYEDSAVFFKKVLG
jgi:GNAT superfamily N-acetyltransferase